MISITPTGPLQTTTPTPGTGPEQLVDFWPVLVRSGWFLAGFLVVALVGWYVLAPVVSRVVRRRNRNNPTIQDAVVLYFRLLVLLVAAAVGAGFAGYGRLLNSSALVVAAATLALGVAGQTVFGSLISGLVLVFDPEFNVGNYVEWDGGSGTIESITLRVTRVKTPDGGLVTVPNTVLTGQPITRPYGRRRHRIAEHVGLAYDDDVDEAMDHLEAASADVPEILAEPAPAVYVEDLDSDEVVLRAEYWIEQSDPRTIASIRSRYVREIKARLQAADITISPASQHELDGRIEVDDPARPVDGRAP